MTDELKRRQNLTFSQAEGLTELPRPLKLGEMPHGFRAELWAEIYNSSRHNLDGWISIAKNLWVVFYQKPIDEFPVNNFVDDDSRVVIAVFKNPIFKDSYNQVFDLLGAIMKYRECPSQLPEQIGRLLQKYQMAYFLDTSGTPTFMPVSTPEEGKAVRDAMEVVAKSGIDGAHVHLRKAAAAINKNQFADAVRESISAVESVAKVIGGDKKGTLTSALKKLESEKLLSHNALSESFQKLYGYTCDENGIRHSLLENGAANVGEEEALFMFGACASFCGYLCRKRGKMKV